MKSNKDWPRWIDYVIGPPIWLAVLIFAWIVLLWGKLDEELILPFNRKRD